MRVRRRVRTPTTRCSTWREIGPVNVADEASRRTMEAADGIKEEGIVVMLTTIPDPPKTGGVEAMRTGKGNTPQNVGTVARKATGRASAGKSVLIRIEPGPDPVLDIPTKGTGSDRTTPKDPEKLEKGLPS